MSFDSTDSLQSYPDEDEFLEVHQIHSDLVETGSGLDEVDNTFDTVVAMERLLATMERLDRYSASHEDLIQSTMMFTAAGTGVSMEDLLPPTESQTSRMERFRAIIKIIWEKIWSTLKAISEQFINFWKRVLSSTERISLALERLKYKAKAASGRGVTSPTITVGREGNQLAIRGLPPSTPRQIAAGLLELRRQLDIIMGYHADNVVAVGTALNRALGADRQYSVNYLEGVLLASDALNINGTAAKLLVKPYKDNRFRTGEVQVAPALMGNKSLFVRKDPLYRDDNPSLLHRAEAIRQLGIRLDRSQNNFKPIIEMEITTIPAVVILQIADQLTGLLKTATDFADGQARKKITATYNDLLKTGEGLKAYMESNPISQTDLANFSSALKFSTTFAKWSERPQDEMVVHTLMVIRSVISVCYKSLHAHG